MPIGTLPSVTLGQHLEQIATAEPNEFHWKNGWINQDLVSTFGAPSYLHKLQENAIIPSIIAHKCNCCGFELPGSSGGYRYVLDDMDPVVVCLHSGEINTVRKVQVIMRLERSLISIPSSCHIVYASVVAQLSNLVCSVRSHGITSTIRKMSKL